MTKKIFVWIRPLRDWNQIGHLSAWAGTVCLNQTFEGLKFFFLLTVFAVCFLFESDLWGIEIELTSKVYSSSSSRLNQTFEGLKSASAVACSSMLKGLNQTFEGLKSWIELLICRGLSCLNQTFEGLKCTYLQAPSGLITEFESDLWGIEMIYIIVLVEVQFEFESDLWGIEIRSLKQRKLITMSCLNQTFEGLKWYYPNLGNVMPFLVWIRPLRDWNPSAGFGLTSSFSKFESDLWGIEIPLPRQRGRLSGLFESDLWGIEIKNR